MNNTIYKPQARNLKKSICHIIYLQCTRAFRSRRHWQVLSAEMRFSADKGLSAEMSAAVGFLAEKSEIEQIFFLKCQIRAVCTGDCLLDDMPEHKFYSVSES